MTETTYQIYIKAVADGGAEGWYKTGSQTKSMISFTITCNSPPT